MKKIHLFLLIVTAITTLFSAYSLAAINQVYKINFEWYSSYNVKYVSDSRNTNRDRWFLEEYPKSTGFKVIGSSYQLNMLNSDSDIREIELPDADFGKNVYLFCTLGEVNSPEYRVKIIDIAQRGNVVEVRVSINSPLNAKEITEHPEFLYFPQDVIKIDKMAFPIRGKLRFIFKAQDGNQINQLNYDLR